jgi:hypothetical protein
MGLRATESLSLTSPVDSGASDLTTTVSRSLVEVG